MKSLSVAAVLVLVASPLWGQDAPAPPPVVQTVQPQAVIVSSGVCPNCGQIHANTPVVSPGAAGNSGFALANRQRAARGLGPLSLDPQLQRGAEIKVARAARLGITGHQGGSFYGGNKEGVGWSTNQTAMACYLYSAPAGTPAGVAMAQGRRGWHTVLLIKHNGYLPSGATGPARTTVRRTVGRLRLFRRR